VLADQEDKRFSALNGLRATVFGFFEEGFLPIIFAALGVDVDSRLTPFISFCERLRM